MRDVSETVALGLVVALQGAPSCRSIIGETVSGLLLRFVWRVDGGRVVVSEVDEAGPESLQCVVCGLGTAGAEHVKRLALSGGVPRGRRCRVAEGGWRGWSC
jgi:hypothetical protein